MAELQGDDDPPLVALQARKIVIALGEYSASEPRHRSEKYVTPA
jgi:hypothetical protein